MSNSQKKRRATVKNPLLVGREPGVWHRDLVGLIPGYAATKEGYRRRQEAARQQARSMNDKGQRGSRKGVPDGFGGRRAEVDAIRSETRQAARDAVAVLSQRGVIGPEAEDEKGPAPILEGEQQRETVETAFAKTLDPTMSDRARVKALRLVLRLIDDKKQNLPQETTN